MPHSAEAPACSNWSSTCSNWRSQVLRLDLARTNKWKKKFKSTVYKPPSLWYSANSSLCWWRQSVLSPSLQVRSPAWYSWSSTQGPTKLQSSCKKAEPALCQQRSGWGSLTWDLGSSSRGVGGIQLLVGVGLSPPAPVGCLFFLLTAWPQASSRLVALPFSAASNFCLLDLL